MKNVTKILTAAILCAALFASTNRTDALGGNPAFWPGDEANIAAFPAQMNNHAFVQLTGVGVGGNSAALLFNNEGTTWGFDWNNNGTDWFNIKWGNGDMGVSVGILSVDDGAGGTTSGHKLGWGKAFSWGEIGISMYGNTVETAATAGTDAVAASGDYAASDGTPDSGNCGDGDDDCGDASVDVCSGGGHTDANACTTDATCGETCSGGGHTDSNACTTDATCSTSSCSDPQFDNSDACLAEMTPGSCDCVDSSDASAGTDAGSCAAVVCTDTSAGVWTPEANAGNTWDTLTDQACNYTWTAGSDCGYTWDGAWTDEVGHPGSLAVPGNAATSVDNSGMAINFTRACDFWAFDTMVASYASDTKGTADAVTKISVDWVAHMNAGAADVVWAMGVDMDDDGTNDATTLNNALVLKLI